MFGLGFWEIVIIFSVALIFLGPEKLPEIARWLGKAYGEFRKVASDIRGQMSDFKENITPPPDYVLPKSAQKSPNFTVKKEQESQKIESSQNDNKNDNQQNDQKSAGIAVSEHISSDQNQKPHPTSDSSHQDSPEHDNTVSKT